MIPLKKEFRLFNVLGTRVWWTPSHHFYLVSPVAANSRIETPRVYCSLFGRTYSINTEDPEHDLKWEGPNHIGYFTRRLLNPLEFLFGKFELDS